jgi:predicted ATP-binding protein involved in virulence
MREDFEVVLKKLILDDFRGFGHLEIDFDEKLTVLIAQNGGGKTSILDAIAEQLKQFLIVTTLYEAEPKYYLKGSDVKNGTVGSLCSLICEITYPFEIPKPEEEHDEREFESYTYDCQLDMQVNKTGSQPFFSYNKSEVEKNHIPLEKYIKAVENLYRYSEDSLPTLIYYGAKQANIDFSRRKSKHL